MELQTIWFILSALLFAIYTITDGFDLGVGMLHVFCNDENEKLTSLYTIWPVWNGNEVWLVGGIGSLLAAFPPVYTTLLSSMYVFVFIFLVAIIAIRNNYMKLLGCNNSWRNKFSS